MRREYVDNLVESTEMFNYALFVRSFHMWKISHLLSRFVPITNDFQLPWNSVLHVLDNIQYPDDQMQDTPRIELNPFIKNEKYRKVIHHVKNFELSDKEHHCPIDIDFKSGAVSDLPTKRDYIFITSKLTQNILDFKSKYKTMFKPVDNLQMLPKAKEVLCIVNHNPLFRAKVRGKLSVFRKTQLLLASILNTACTITIEKNQYIHIPLTTNVFSRSDFKKSKTVLNMTSIKYPNNYHYIVMMNILNFVDELATTSMLDNIPEEYLSRIVLVLTVGDKAIFLQLSDLKPLNKKNSSYLRYVNMFNMLALSQNPDMMKVLESIPDEEEGEDNDVTPHGDTASTVQAVTSTAKEIANKIITVKRLYSKDDVSLLDRILKEGSRLSEDISKIDLSVKKKAVTTTAEDVDDPTDMSVSDEYEDDTPTKIEEHIEKDVDLSGIDMDDTLAEDTRDLIDVIIKHDQEYIRDKQIKQLSVNVNSTKQQVSRSHLKGSTPIDVEDLTTVIDVDINGFKTNSPSVKYVKETPKQSSSRSIKYMMDQVAEAHELIDNTESLTPAQKERYKKLSVGYKNIVLGDRTVDKWITQPMNDSVEENTLDFLKGTAVDENMLKSSVITMDQQYMEKTFAKDILTVATSFTKNGVFLTDVKVESKTNELNKTVNYVFKYEDINGKTSSINLTLPDINKYGHMYINGVKKLMKKQMVDLPIVKVSSTRVSLSSAMNKTIVERTLATAYSFDKYIGTILKKLSLIPGITVDTISASVSINEPIAYEYTALAKSYKSIDISSLNHKLSIIFDRHLYMEKLTPTIRKYIDEFSKKKKCVPFIIYDNTYGCIDINNNLIFMDRQGFSINTGMPTSIISLLYILGDHKLKYKPLSEYTTLKIRDKAIPIGFVLSYQYGLINVLNYLGCSWFRIGKKDKRIIQHVENKKRKVPIPGIKYASESFKAGDVYKLTASDIVIPFKDEILIINRYPIVQSFIIAGLNAFHTEYVNFNSMDDVGTYFTLLEMKGWSTNYLKAITGFFNYFMDHMTRDKLEMMHEPTNVRDLLIRSTQLLATEDARPPASMANHCMRSYERMSVIAYNEMARALEEHQISGGANSKFSINPVSVFMRIVTDQSITSVEELNPIHDIKEQTGFVYTGVGGRTSQSFVLIDRQYPEDGVGKISEATVDSGKVGIVAATSMNPTIANTRGVFYHKDAEKLDPTEYLSISSLLMPCVTNDDGKRMGFCSHQLSHHIPTVDSDVMRLRTGYERIVAHRASSSFTGVAKHNGVVEKLDKKLSMLRVKYENGDTDVFSYEDRYTGSSGLVMEQKMRVTVEEGQSVKQGDVLVYNPQFFKKDPYSTQVDWKHGVMLNVCIAEFNTTLQDASCISRRAGDRFGITPAEPVVIVIDSNSMVHDIVQVGQHVKRGDPLITVEDGDLGEVLKVNTMSEDTLEMIQELQRNKEVAPISGIVAKIDAYYGCPTTDMHPTLGDVIRSIEKHKLAKHKFSKGTDAEYDYPLVGPLPKNEKYKNVDFNEHTVVLEVYITETIGTGIGDKLVYDSSLKSVISDVIDEPMTTLSGVEVDAIFSGSGINRRTITSPLITGTIQRVLEKVEHDIIDWWDTGKE